MDQTQRLRRKQMRASSWDYSNAGAYFITAVTHRRIHHFGTIESGMVHLKPAGEMIERYWLELESKYPCVEQDEFVIMPNHIHGILVVNSDGTNENRITSLGDIVKWFKTMSTNGYIHGVKEQNWPRFDGKLWQQGYWDHIIRNDRDLERIREYIYNNPFQWEQDPDNEASEEAWNRTIES